MGGFFPEPRQEGPSRGDEKDERADSRGYGGGSRGDQESHLLLPEGHPRNNREVAYCAAGIVGIDPKPFTLRELLWMKDAKERSDWDKAAMVVAKIHNVNAAKSSDCIQFADVHPYYSSEEGSDQVGSDAYARWQLGELERTLR